MATTPPPSKTPLQRPGIWKLVSDQTLITDEVRDHPYPGSGTTTDPYVVDWIDNDPRHGFNFPQPLKVLIVLFCAFNTLASSLSSSIFAGAIIEVQSYFGVSEEVSILPVSLFVLGFAIGPIVWGPLSEMYGRQAVNLGSLLATIVFEGASIACNKQDIVALIVLRFFAGWCAAAAMSNSPAIVADVFVPAERGLAIMGYAIFPFLGPTLGPVCGNFLASAAGWRWVDVLTTFFFTLMFLYALFIVPETYAPYILRRRATLLSRATGKAYVSKLDVGNPPKRLLPALKLSLIRPLIMTVWEPISTTLAIYMAVVYGTLYLIFAAFPIIYQQERGWSQGISGLAYCGIIVGQILGGPFFFVLERRYRRKIAQPGVVATPEMRLEPAMWGAIFLPLSLFWFAWTSFTSIHWAVGIVGSMFFGLGNVLVFTAMMNYIIDTYVLYAATAMASNSIFRASFGAIFPLFTTYMYRGLGTQWASSIPAFLVLLFLPSPFILFKYGPYLRARSKFANEAKDQLTKLEEIRKEIDHKREMKEESTASEQGEKQDESD